MRLPRAFFDKERIRQQAVDVVRQYEHRRGNPVTYPLDPADLFSTLFDLDTIYDDEGRLNAIEPGIIGGLYPDGCPSPWGRDKLIVVNATRLGSDVIVDDSMFPPEFRGGEVIRSSMLDLYSDRFTIAHEGMGHYVLQFRRGIREERATRLPFCWNSKQSPLEWNANFAAGELLMPFDKVLWLLDGKRPGEIIDAKVYAKNFLEYFGAHRAMMEARLKSLRYRVLNARYPWADHVGTS